jgi:hypothetical protein
MTITTWGANFKVIGKTDPQNLSYSGAFKPMKGTFADLEGHIGKGHPWMPSLLDGNGKRWQANANYAELAALDIDHGMTIEEAMQHPFISQHLALGIESASSSPEHHKFRLIFRYFQPVQGWQQIRTSNEYLQFLVGTADKSCKDASRYFFGAQGRSPFHLDESATLPESFVPDALAWQEQNEAIAEREYEAARQRRRQYQGQQNDESELIEQALSCIPPRSPGSGNYSDWMIIAAALTHQLGDVEAIALLERYSPSVKGTTWDVSKKVRSFAKGTTRPCTLGSLFYVAKTEQQN